MAGSGMDELKQRAEQYLMEMANLIGRREYNLALVKGRQAMEQVVRSYAGESRVLYTDLADTIESLYQGRKISRETRDALHHIRLLGNKAVHEGDNNPEDAEKSYYLLKKELEVYLNHTAAAEANRVPVQINRNNADASAGAGQRGQQRQSASGIDVGGYGQPGIRQTSGQRASYQPYPEDGGDADDAPKLMPRRRRQDGGRDRNEDGARGRVSESRARRNNVPTREDRLRAQRRQGARRQGGIVPADLLKILLPVIAIILIIVIVRGCVNNNAANNTTSSSSETASTAPTESTAPETTEPETTTAAVVLYQVKAGTSGVKLRYADNQNRVYELVDGGTQIGEVQEIEGSDFVKFQRDGVDVVINKNYIEPVEGSGSTSSDSASAGGTGSTGAAAGTGTGTTSGTSGTLADSGNASGSGAGTSSEEALQGGSGRVKAVLQIEETTGGTDAGTGLAGSNTTE